jgi:hypothetical protein
VFDVLIYVLKKEGAYQYDPTNHTLYPVKEGDFRNLLAEGQVLQFLSIIIFIFFL